MFYKIIGPCAKIKSLSDNSGFLLTLKIVTFVFISTICQAQKSSLDAAAIENWPEIEGAQISNDGKYVSYTEERNEIATLVICSTESSFKKEFSGHARSFIYASFSEDSRYFIFSKPKDTLCILNLETNKESCFPNCKSYKIADKGNNNWLAYHRDDNILVLSSLSTGEQKQFLNVVNYQFSEKGNVLLITISDSLDDKTIKIKWIDLLRNNMVKIWQGENPTSFEFDPAETQIAFVANNKKSEKAIWYYEKGMDSAQLWVSGESLSDSFEVRNDLLQFSPLGDRLFFNIYAKQGVVKLPTYNAMVDVWSYNDEFLQPEQLRNMEFDKKRPFKAVIHKKNMEVIRLEKVEDLISYQPNLNIGDNDNFFLVQDRVNQWEGKRMPKEVPNIYLVSTKDGSRKCIIERLYNSNANFSPGGKYVYWYDPVKRTYFTYNIDNGITQNITGNISFPIFNESWDNAIDPPKYGLGGWLENDEAVLIYDKYDIWQIDPAGKRPPVNLTNGYGRKNKIILRYVKFENQGTVINKNVVSFLCGFNEKSKENGFFKIKLGPPANPTCLIMSPHAYYFSETLRAVSLPSLLKKAKDADTYLLSRMNSHEFPNLYTTKEFKDFLPVSNLVPQKKYNWLTSELMSWKTFDGHDAQGILYKPEDFNPQKKYPIIFYCYETLSAGLNLFIKPELSDGPINIPFYLSRGYLIFCPDIHYTVGMPGESAYNYVIPAVNILKNKPWVDSKRMGIQGHSFGGYEVNCLITMSKLFAASSSAAGLSDLVSAANGLYGYSVAHPHVELGQLRMGTTIWQNQRNYINNSPLYKADKIVTPLLIMHNKNDGGVLWSQSIGLFAALRRLNKVAWLLQYDRGYHVLSDDEDKLDYTIRLQQFFDHYLKYAPAPIWMTKGVPAKLKQIETGYTYDPSGTCSKDCKVCKMWNEKLEKDSAACWKEIERRMVEEHWQ